MEKNILEVLGRLRCLFMRHEPNRRRVRRQAGGGHLGYCRYCGTKIRRRGYGDWVPSDWVDGKGDQDAG